MFSGLSAFPLTPLNAQGALDTPAFVALIERLKAARVASMGVLGSTGCYAYFNREERQQALSLAVQHAGDIPVLAGIGSISLRDVLIHAQDAAECGASALLLAPVSYQPLTEDEVFNLFARVAEAVPLPLVLYENSATTHFIFSDALIARIGQAGLVASVKIIGADAHQRIPHLRSQLPGNVTVGVAGDAFAAHGLDAGGDIWYSVLGGLFPGVCQAIVRASDHAQAAELSARLEPLWALFRQYGSLRVVATLAVEAGLVAHYPLPLPLLPLDAAGQQATRACLPLLQAAG